MITREYIGTYAGHEIRFRFRHFSTYRYFNEYLNPIDEESDDIRADIVVSPERYERTRLLLPADSRPGYIESRSCIGLVAKHLLQWDCCVFHAVAFEWKDKAWLLTAPSGTGKTTQFLNWQKLYPEEIQVICGDMPVLERTGSGVMVHPSSWNGKEDLRGNVSAPLGGIVILRQGQLNCMEKTNFQQSLSAMLEQMIVRPDTENEADALSGLVGAMLSVPVLKYTNLGNHKSTELLRTNLKKLY